MKENYKNKEPERDSDNYEDKITKELNKIEDFNKAIEQLRRKIILDNTIKQKENDTIK